ncbi:acyl-[acyl-carrier-protein] thioesterase [[Clostridium] fimetarium]|uniref:Acyl-ACP thioesterase n=1 Tax=[Clostridium] fimetarium TaxID=99656 RepID=A0A1I0M4H5_9FIRM|nr:acyl-ACP thioesterase domain-containing protein [[Clostridium] fimetarium]SEV82854.1 Acyl-ACP thioesterase [[Clostridium] fimetarium]
MYSFDSMVRYSETDKNEKLSVTGLVNYFQDCSSFHSETLHIGTDELAEAHRAWVLSSWQIVINRMPQILDCVKVSTWPYAFERFCGTRNFTIVDKEGEIIACANSMWVFINTDTGRPVLPESEFKDAYILEDKYEAMNYEGRKIFALKNMKKMESFHVRKCNLDTYNHVNNGQYIQMAEEYLPEGFEVGQIRAEYKMSAHYGDAICPYVQIEEEERFVIDLRNEDGKTFALIEFAKTEF